MKWLRTGTKMLTLEVAIIALFVVPAAIYAATTLNTTIKSSQSLNSPATLLLHYAFDGASPLTDASGNGRDGAVTGGGGQQTAAYSSAGAHAFSVPAGVTSIVGKVWGAGGGGGGQEGAGGGGGFASSTLSVTPFESLDITVGAKGSGGQNLALDEGGGGGGFSQIERGGTPLLIGAGGGGGGGNGATGFTDGGAGGGSSGVDGDTDPIAGVGGGGGTQVGGGIGGAGGSSTGVDGVNGSSEAGGAGGDGDGGGTGNGAAGGSPGGANGGNNTATRHGGGGGGGGYYGGGGGEGAGSGGGGGGGGSSYTTGSQTAKVAGSGKSAGNNTDTDYASSAGAGGDPEVNGNDGRVVIVYTATAGSVTQSQGKIGSSIFFDGTYKVATSSGTSISNVRTVGVWIKVATTPASQGIVHLAGSTVYISTNGSKALSATGFTSPTYYIDGVASSSPGIYDNDWHHIAVTTATPITATRLEVGFAGSTFFSGRLDDLRLYTQVLSATEVMRLYGLGGTTYLNTSIKSNTAVSPSAASGLVGWWTFDGANLVQNATDSSGRGNTGYLQNFTATTTSSGRLGQALEFDGSNDVVRVNDADSLDATSNVSIALWVKADNWSGGGGGNVSTLVKKDQNYILRKDTDVTYGGTGLKLFWNDGVNLDVHIVALPSVGEWHHIVGVNENNTTRRIYIDGVLQSGSDDLNNTEATSYTNPLGIGDNPSGGGEQFDGLLDDVRIYNRVLSATEIKRLYDLGGTTYVNTSIKSNPQTSPSSSSGLVGWWTFDGPNLLQNATDSSGQGNHLRLRHFAATTTTPGRIGQALDFDGTNDAAVSSSTPVSTVPLTLCAWFMRHSGNGVIVQVDDGEASGTADYFSLRITTGNLIARISVNSNTSGTSGPAPTLDEWHHACAVFTSSTLRDLYYDGAFYDTNTTSGTPSGVIYTTVGDNTSSTNASLDGSIDDVRIYNRALSAAEIQRLYQLGQ